MKELSYSDSIMPKTMQRRNEKKISKVIGWTEMANGFHKCSWFSIPEWKTMGDQLKLLFQETLHLKNLLVGWASRFLFVSRCLNLCWDWWPNTWRSRDWLSQCLTFPTPWEIVSHPQSCRKKSLPFDSISLTVKMIKVRMLNWAVNKEILIILTWYSKLIIVLCM